MPRYTGGCLCRAVRYVADAEPVNQRVCHCRMCQKAIGAAFNARLLFRADDVKVNGQLDTFNSSPELQRGFCSQCGTTVLSIRASAGLVAITAGTLDDPSLFEPAMHFWTASRQAWVRLDDGLPAYPEAAPA
jgi:hypothetical protein